METLSWDVLALHLTAGSPCTVQMGGTRGVVLTYDPVTRALALNVPAGNEEAIPSKPFEELVIRLTEFDGIRRFEISTTEPDLYREFHRFAGLLTEDFQEAGRSAGHAFEAAIDRWRSFAAVRTPMSPEAQIGLLGELIFLRSLIERFGPFAVESWTAQVELRPGRHDFALPDVDVEVKTTRGNSREHLIHGLGQLTPVDGRELFILSLRAEPSGVGKGTSLPECVSSIRDLLPLGSAHRRKFEIGLGAAHYRDADASSYDGRIRLADNARLVVVDSLCPRIQPSMLEATIGTLAAKVSQVSYRISIDGLGVEEGTDEFCQIVGFLRMNV